MSQPPPDSTKSSRPSPSSSDEDPDLSWNRWSGNRHSKPRRYHHKATNRSIHISSLSTALHNKSPPDSDKGKKCFLCSQSPSDYYGTAIATACCKCYSKNGGGGGGGEKAYVDALTVTALNDWSGKCRHCGHRTCDKCYTADVAFRASGTLYTIPGYPKVVYRSYQTSSGKKIGITRASTIVHQYGMCSETEYYEDCGVSFPQGKCHICVDIPDGYCGTVIGGTCCKCFKVFKEEDLEPRELKSIGEMRELEKWM